MTCRGSIDLFVEHDKLPHGHSIGILYDIDLHDGKKLPSFDTRYMINYDRCFC